MLFNEIEGFAEEVVELADKTGSYIDSVLELCIKYNIEPQVAAKMLSKPLIEKIEREGRLTNILPQVPSLPV
jgi:hypothetical protein